MLPCWRTLPAGAVRDGMTPKALRELAVPLNRRPPCQPNHTISKACVGNVAPAICRQMCCKSMHNALPVWCNGTVPET